MHFRSHLPRSRSFPDWKFSILTYDRPGGQLLCEFHLELDLNPAAQHYILNHPRWRKDMRPLILWVIREILLSVKIVDAKYGVEEKKSCGLEDAKRGVVFEGRLWTKKHVDQEDVTWIHVGNYANTPYPGFSGPDLRPKSRIDSNRRRRSSDASVLSRPARAAASRACWPAGGGP